MRPTHQGPNESPHAQEMPGLLNLRGHDPEEVLDENLHFGRAWHRYGYCYRPGGPIRVLDAGCGTGLSTLSLARLNPEASVLGVDVSPASVHLARERAMAAGLDGVTFAVHDLENPTPDDWGRFDFVVCRNVMGLAADPARLVAQLAGRLDPKGLLYATFPSRAGRVAHRALRQAVDALAPAGAGLEGRTRIGLELLQSLRPDHPVLDLLSASRTGAPGAQGSPLPDPGRVILECLTDHNEWALGEAAALLEGAGLKPLYAALPWRWQADRVFRPGPLPETLRLRLEAVGPERHSRLVDALDPTALDAEYQLYACHAEHEPQTPSWPRTRRSDTATFGRLVPHLTGLARPDRALPAGSAAQGRTLFRTVGGAIGELDRLAVLRLGAVDGHSSCGEIDRKLASRTRASDDATVRQDCWVHLADYGLILLEPPAAL